MMLILLKPEDLGKGAAYHFSDRIINGLRKEKELAVVGLGNAVSLACMAVQIASNIANVCINELSLDYIGSPSLGIGGIFFGLDKESTIDWDQQRKDIESRMKLDFSPEGQFVIVSKKLPPDKIMPLCLSKLAKSELLRIAATGTSINRAVSLALEITKGNIAKEPIGIILVTLSTLKHKIEGGEVLATSIDIYLKRASPTAYTKKHKEIAKMLE